MKTDKSPGAARRPEAVLAALAGVWAFAVLARGAVDPWACGLAALLAAALAFLVRPAEGAGLPARAWALLLGVGAFYLLPLPAFLLEAASPDQAAVLRDHGIEWGRLGVDTEAAALRLAAAAACVGAADLACRCVRAGARPGILMGAVVAVAVLAGLWGIGGRAAGGGDSLSGTYVNRNHFAALAGTALPFAFALVWGRLREARGRPGRGDLAFCALAGGAALLLVAFLVLSRSRGGMLAALAGLAVFACVLRRKEARAALVAAILLGAGLVFGTGAGEGALERFAITGPAAEGRLSIWSGALGMISRTPALGVGPGGFGAAFPKFKPADFPYEASYAHNDYVEIAAELGVPALLVLLWGLLAWFGTVGILVRERGSARRPLAAASVAAVCVFLLHGLVEGNLALPANAMLLGLVLGAAWGAAVPRPTPSARPWLRLAAPAAAAVPAVLVLACQLLPWTAPHAVQRRIEALGGARPEEVLRRAGEAVARAPLNHRAHYAEAAALFQLGRFDDSDRELEIALRCGPHQRNLLLKAGQLLLARPDAAATPERRRRALESFRAAASLDRDGTALAEIYGHLPRAPLKDLESVTPPSHVRRLGERLIEEGRREELAAAVLRLCPADAEGADALERLGAAALAASWFAEAAEILDRACAIRPDFRRLVLLGSACEKLADGPRARRAYEGALRERPGDAEIRRRAAHYLMAEGDFERARSHFEEALAIVPDHREARLGLAACAARTRRREEAVRIYEKMLRESPGDREAAIALAQLLIEAGRLPEARERLERYVTAATPDPVVLALLRRCRP